uniref:DNA-binding bromodomain-containing protein n=1 Tax=Tanacetum cinerariifolium TaxID=118510 RepID=A0A699GNV5_TANCI|nr:DNA-binding bromodomain-containing protein [Tanacetum cinerariifolium]
MTHRYGGVFNQPVDPVQLGILNYFDVISYPMDFRTISKKLEKDVYSSEEAFAVDIRLTFANAMRYNPLSNFVHKMAKEMKDIFEIMWKLFETKLAKLRKSIAKQGKLKKKPLDTSKIANSLPDKTFERNTIKKSTPSLILKFKKAEDTSTITTCSVSKPLVSREEKINLKREPISAVRGDWTGPLRWFLRKYGLLNQIREKIEHAFNLFNDDALLELSRALKGSFGTSTEKVYVYTSQGGHNVDV